MENIWLVFVFAVGIVVSFFFVRPERARCPSGWFVEGVRPSGVSHCRRAPPDDPLDWPGNDPRDRGDRDVKPDNAVLPVRVYCTGGSIPIVVDERTVGCQRNPQAHSRCGRRGDGVFDLEAQCQ